MWGNPSEWRDRMAKTFKWRNSKFFSSILYLTGFQKFQSKLGELGFVRSNLLLQRIHGFHLYRYVSVRYPHKLIRYCLHIYVVWVSSHFWPFSKANFVFTKKMWFSQTAPPPLVWTKSQVLPFFFWWFPYTESLHKGGTGFTYLGGTYRWKWTKIFLPQA